MKTKETPEQHLARLRNEIETMDYHSQLIARNVLLLGESIALCLTHKQYDVIDAMQEEVAKLFAQANSVRQEMDKDYAGIVQ